MEWVPTFSFDHMFQQNIRRSKPPEYVRLLAGVRLLKLFNINNGEVAELQGKAELPVLAVVYRPEMYHSRFADTLPSAGASFCDQPGRAASGGHIHGAGNGCHRSRLAG